MIKPSATDAVFTFSCFLSSYSHKSSLEPKPGTSDFQNDGYGKTACAAETYDRQNFDYLVISRYRSYMVTAPETSRQPSNGVRNGDVIGDGFVD